jgi:hypothetical protein
MAFPLGHASADEPSDPVFHLCSVVLAPKDSFFLMDLHCIRCRSMFHYTTEEWLGHLRTMLPMMNDSMDEGMPISYVIVCSVGGQDTPVTATRKNLPSVYAMLSHMSIFCVQEESAHLTQ